MAFVKETHTAPTYTKTNPGYGILCNNTDILCNTEKYYCDGAIVMTKESISSTTYTKELY